MILFAILNIEFVSFIPLHKQSSH